MGGRKLQFYHHERRQRMESKLQKSQEEGVAASTNSPSDRRIIAERVHSPSSISLPINDSSILKSDFILSKEMPSSWALCPNSFSLTMADANIGMLYCVSVNQDYSWSL